MKIMDTELAGVKIIEPRVFDDPRGYFFESFHGERYAKAGITQDFVQDNVSWSTRGTLRGLHFQQPNAQGKLIGCLYGEIFDVAVDLRRSSPTFGHWIGMPLTSSNKRQFWIPPGFAHGFQVLSETALVMYKCDAYYSPGTEKVLSWNDPDIQIRWPLASPILSEKDQCGILLRDMNQSILFE